MKFASQSFPGELASNWYREDIRLAENRLRLFFQILTFFIPHSFELIMISDREESRKVLCFLLYV